MCDSFETNFYDKPYVFCDENLSDYEKTIYILALAYANDPICRLTERNISELSCFLKVDVQLLTKALQAETHFPYGCAVVQFGDEKIVCGDFFKNTFFDIITKMLWVYKNLDELFDSAEADEINENLQVFNSILVLFDIINASTSTYECICKNRFSFENTMYDSPEGFSPKDHINMMRTLLLAREYIGYDAELLRILNVLLKYEFRTRFDALHLVTICQILKNSPCYKGNMSCIATEMYDKLLTILKNGRVISIRGNIIPINPDKLVKNRTKRDNTTRIQILYGYSNYDCYELRLDYSHQGQEFVHFNNESPGKVSCCMFTKSEYEAFIAKYPSVASCFISYGSQYALKERVNCNEPKEVMKYYDEIVKSKSHDAVFSQAYEEAEINKFIDSVFKMLPPQYVKKIDFDGSYAKKCFDYDVIMRDITWLYLAYISEEVDTVKKLFEKISKRAVSYGLADEQIPLDTLNAVCEIAKIAENHIR